MTVALDGVRDVPFVYAVGMDHYLSKGRVALVTGASKGLGLSLARLLAERGLSLVIDARGAQALDATRDELSSRTQVAALCGDVADAEHVHALVALAKERFGRIDVLINNAGIMPIGPFVEETDATAARLIDINLHGVIFGSKLAIERFSERGAGHLVNIASTAGKAGVPGGATYCATKHAVVGLSEAIRGEVRDSGIDVSVVMPVVVNTELGSGLPEMRGFKSVEPEDVADAIVEALQRPRYEVYVPKSIGLLMRSKAVVPTVVADLVGRLLKGDQVLANPDHAARAAYEERMEQTISTAEGSTTPAPESSTPERETQAA